MVLHGKSLIAGKRSSRSGETFRIISPLDLSELPGEFLPAALTEVDEAMEAARSAFPAFRSSSGETRALFLETIADNLIALGDTLIDRASRETGLPPKRLRSELDRTTGHLRMFGEIAREGSWLDPRTAPADPDRQPTPRPELRRIFQPIGPVIVFGSSNFPLAYSVAGGDTASALATGNPVIVKAHEAHPGTSELVAEAIVSAAEITGLPPGIFSMLQGPGKLLAVPLVTHPATRAVGFTGSTHAGRILIDAAAKRPDPIPVFAEMGSLNPIVILPSALEDDARTIAEKLTASITTDAGQFCTKPGIILIPDQNNTGFLDALSEGIRTAKPAPMLHQGIHKTFHEGAARLSAHSGVRLLARNEAAEGTLQGSPHLFLTDSRTFLSDGFLRHEFFGPLAIVVSIPSGGDIEGFLRSLGGQLTASLFCREGDPAVAGVLPLLTGIAGRIIYNGVPTGVEVNSAIQHGGPWPACSDSRFSAVGPSALLRFVRPVAFQNFPEALLKNR